jgi:hypothetical protein
MDLGSHSSSLTTSCRPEQVECGYFAELNAEQAGKRHLPARARRGACLSVTRSHLCGWEPPQRPPGRGFAANILRDRLVSQGPSRPKPPPFPAENDVSGCPGSAGYMGGSRLKAMSSHAWESNRGYGFGGLNLGYSVAGWLGIYISEFRC